MGKVYLYHGSPAGLESEPAWTAEGEVDSGYFGYALGPAGDVNGDGYDDLAVGAYGYDGGRGKVYLYLPVRRPDCKWAKGPAPRRPTGAPRAKMPMTALAGR